MRTPSGSRAFFNRASVSGILDRVHLPKIHKFMINKKVPLIQRENIVRSAKLLVMEGAISRILDPDPNSPASSAEYPNRESQTRIKIRKNLVASLEKTLNRSLQDRLLLVLP